MMLLMNCDTSTSLYFGSGVRCRLRSARFFLMLRYFRPSLHRTSTALLPLGDARGVQRPADDVVPDARKILHPAAADQHDRVLLEIVPLARDVGGDLDAVARRTRATFRRAEFGFFGVVV